MSAFIKRHYISIAFVTTLVSAIAYIYSTVQLTVLITAASLAYTTMVFLLFDFCNKKQNKWITCGIFLALLSVSVMLGFVLMTGSGQGFIQMTMWFFQPVNTDVRAYPQFAFGLMILFGFFLDIAVYYFSTIRYRRLMLFLACLCPFALFAKTFTDIPVIYSILTVIFYFLIMFKHNAGVNGRNGDTMTINDKGYAVTSVAFALAVIATASFLPKPETAPYREQFDNFITGVQLKGVSTAAFGDFSNSSSTSSQGANNEEVLYTVKSGRPIYLRRQVFDIYNGVGWTYLNTDTYNTGYKGWENSADAYNLSEIADYLYALTGEERLKQYADSVTTTKISVEVQKEFSADVRIVPSVCGMTDADGVVGNSEVYHTPKDEYFTSESRSGKERLTLTYYDNKVTGDFSDILTFEYMKDLFVAAGSENGDSYSDAYQMLRHYYTMQDDAQEYYEQCVSDYEGQAEVEALARKITENCGSDYEKAKALESYFTSSGFTYDLNYVAPTKGVVYFLFDSKRGTCSDFATAMALMSRAVGLPTRYVEGFSMSETDENGNFVVRVADSHAFPEIFIGGMGWVDFEPTIAGTQNDRDETFIVIIIGTIAASTLAAVLLVFMLAPHFRRLKLRRRYSKADSRGKISIVYSAVEALVCERLCCKAGTLTATELRDEIASRYKIDAGRLCDCYNKAVYGGENISSENLPQIYKSLQAAIKSEKRAEKQAKKLQKRTEKATR